MISTAWEPKKNICWKTVRFTYTNLFLISLIFIISKIIIQKNLIFPLLYYFMVRITPQKIFSGFWAYYETKIVRFSFKMNYYC